MTKGGPLYKTETLVSYIYNQGFQVAPYDLGYASSIAVYLFLMVAIITFVLRRFVLNRGNRRMKIKKIKVNEIVGTAVTVLIAVLILFPLIWLLVSSFKSDADVIKWPPIFFPTQWLTAQYKYVVDAIPILSMLKNTVVFQ